jgi:phosphoribosylamine--glycine ligase
MKFFMYSECGEGAGLLDRIQQEGNEVSLYIHDRIYRDVWDGLLPKVNIPTPDKDALILFDMSGNGATADSFRRSGHLVYGASALMDQLECDRDFGFDVMKQVGIKIPKTEKFKSFKDGIEYVSKHTGKLVFKPNGSMPCKLTYVSENAEELIAYLRFVEVKFGKNIDDFLLQDFVKGCVVSSEAFCDGQKFIRPCNHTVEAKKFMDGEHGPSTGCSGNVTWLDETQIMASGIMLAEEYCVKNGYVGQIDLNAVVNEDGVFGLEWTPRMGYDATPCLFSLIKGDVGEFFSDLLSGQLKKMPMVAEYGASVRFSIPPYPAELLKGKDSEKFSPNEGIPIQGFESVEDEIYFYEVLCKDGQLVHSSGTGVLGITLGMDSNCKIAINDCYDVLEFINVPDLQYRTDLDTVLSSMVEEISEYA